MDTAYLHLEINSESLMMHTSVSVIIPQNIKRNEKIKTLYLLHGYRGNHMDWIRYTSIERYAQKYRMAVIMPEVNNAYYANMEKGLDYFTYVADELPQIIESLFPLSRKREDRYIAGLSMGGYGAFKIASKRPHKFSKAISLSGSMNIITIRDISKEEEDKRQGKMIALITQKNEPLNTAIQELNSLLGESQKDRAKLNDIAKANTKMIGEHDERLDNHNDRLIVLETKNGVKRITYREGK